MFGNTKREKLLRDEGARVAAMGRAELGEAYRDGLRSYADRVNLFVRQEADGTLPSGGKEPDSLIEAFSGRLLEILRAEGRLDRAEFPPFHGAVLPLLREHAMWTGGTAWLPEGILLEAGGACWLAAGPGRSEPIPGWLGFGVSPCGTWIGAVVEDGEGLAIEIRQGLSGAVLQRLAVPKSLRGCLDRDDLDIWEGTPRLTEVIVHPNGREAVLVTEGGILVVSGEGARLAYPDRQRIDEGVAAAADCGDGRYAINLSMEHAALSPDGRLLIVGDQCSDHVLMDYGAFEEIGAVLPTVSYPNFAAFTADGSMALVSSCHFYSGETQILDVQAWKDVRDGSVLGITGRYGRVGASVSAGGSVWIGDAHGYIRRLSADAQDGRLEAGRQFLGGTPTGMAISPDGGHLAVLCHSGFLHVLSLKPEDAGADPYRIGAGALRELWSTLFWKESPGTWVW